MARTKKKKKQKQKQKRAKGRSAKTSDRNELYELSVQEPESECDLVDQVWTELRGRTCRHVREDFCGTALVCREWVRRRPDNTAIGVDLDSDVLDWARDRVADKLDEDQAARLRLVEADVRTVQAQPVECVMAMNFSYYLLRTRDELREYFQRVHEALEPDGLMLLDAYGGSDSFVEMDEERELDGFTYVWDQRHYDPITGHATNHIHFRFPDGTRMRKAFTYHWRLWTLPEIREILVEAGFKDVVVYWEGTDDETGEGDGEWTRSTEGEACPGWVAYLAGVK
ncbi:MAG: class I SAM-dependent methyltransferase [Planctomycetota bacterium]|jgi:SAM-dependent methyltransferase